MNTDFDAFASMIAAKKIYPDAQIVISDKQDNLVKQFLNIYRDMFPFQTEKQIAWEDVTDIILVDVSSLKRTGHYENKLQKDKVNFIVYDHHPVNESTIDYAAGKIEPVGAAITLLIEELQQRKIPITAFEATIFGLGIYTDTGFFTFKNTTVRDFRAACFLMEQGMNLKMIKRFTDQQLDDEQQNLLEQLFVNTNIIKLDGLEIGISTYKHDRVIGGLASLTHKLLEMKDVAAMIAVVQMKNTVFIVGRARSERINLLPFLTKWKGGGHKQAGSATLKRTELSDIEQEVMANIELILQPAITAKQMMSSPVKSISPETTIAEAGQLMYRYGHSGYPIVQDGKLVGIITRRDLDKANHHGLGHAPVKAYMTTNLITIKLNTTLEEIQNIVIRHNIGRLPVIDDEGKLAGIVSRTDIIKVLHEQAEQYKKETNEKTVIKSNIKHEIESQLPKEILQILQDISRLASETDTKVYLIGGIVRDIILNKNNDDVDIVVEGDGITFAKSLQKKYGGELIVHEEFGTSTWEHPFGLKIDVASSRLEYYDRPASLPDVEQSTLDEDLSRRDFTINAMAIHLSEERFGDIIDPYSGQEDIYNKKIRILHNLSFVEDPTRILRAVRFEVRFQFMMDEETEQFALQSIDQMNALSTQRIHHEMERLFKEDYPDQVIERLFELTFWQQFSVDEKAKERSIAHAKHLKDALKEMSASKDKEENHWFLYFIVPFYQSEQLERCEAFALTKQHRKVLNEISDLKRLNWLDNTTLGEMHRKVHTYSDKALVFYIEQATQSSEKIKEYLRKRKKVNKLITADDLKELEIKPGPLYSEIFLEVEIATLDKRITSNEQAIHYVRKWIENKG